VTIIDWCERGQVPDRVMRMGMRRLMAERLRRESRGSLAERQTRFRSLLAELRDSPIALSTEVANEQHYEVTAEFFQLVLGKHLKYSGCYWPAGVTDLDTAEAKMLALTCERAQLADGARILELGCGWGSLTLWMATHYPNARITAVSNSSGQKAFIDSQARQRGLGNLEIITADMNDFSADGPYDRVVSVEMFEHMRNYEALLERIAGWLTGDGKLFVHVFCHRELMYPFVDSGQSDWMARNFFTDGLMPAAGTLREFQKDLALEAEWWVDGGHYERTANAWLQNLDRNRSAVTQALAATYGPDSELWLQRWRMFFMACAELFGYQDGTEWFVAHYLFGQRPR
jgi:cyclopropane-fatty-acyl-phospholipid synthase